MGRPIRLAEALASVPSTDAQLEATRAYWRLAEAVARYRFAFEDTLRWEEIEARPEDAALLEVARASASAALSMAEVALLEAQHDLAERCGFAPGAPLPLPADSPHSGTYQTHFEEVFSLRNPPARARLLDRKLPVHQQMIAARAAAVDAAEDAFEAAAEAYRDGRAGFAELHDSLRQLGTRNRELVASARQYNDDIADYALAVAGPQTDSRVLVAMLIRSEGGELSPGRAAESSEVERATWESPGATRREPTLAPPRESLRSLGQKAPSLLPTEDGPERSPEEGPARPPADASTPEVESPPAPPDPDATASAASGEEAAGRKAVVEEEPMVPVEEAAAPPEPDAAPKAAVEERRALRPTGALYPALVDADPAVRAKQLSLVLCGNREGAEPEGDAVGLAECLEGVPSADRAAAIQAYWQAAGLVAQQQALADEVALLEELTPIALERRHESLGAESMLRVRAARRAAEARQLATRLELVEVQFRLARLTGRAVDAPPIVPATPPHAGPYLLKLEAQPDRVVQSCPVRRLAAVIPALSQSVQRRAAAVVDADAARAAATAAYREGRQPIDGVLACIGLQTEETRAFLDGLSKYNDAIAAYALRVLPATATPEQLAEALVVAQPPRAATP